MQFYYVALVLVPFDVEMEINSFLYMYSVSTLCIRYSYVLVLHFVFGSGLGSCCTFYSYGDSMPVPVACS